MAKNRKVIINTGDLDLSVATPLEFNIVMNVDNSSPLQSSTVKYYATEFILYNDCGVDVEILFLTTKEKVEYDVGLPYYDFIRVPVNSILSSEVLNLGRSDFMLVRALDTGATKALRVDLTGYIER